MKLTIDQRIQIENLLGQQKGNVGQIRSLMQLIDKIGIKDEDGVKVIPLPGGLAKFEFEPGEPQEFDLNQRERELLKSTIEAWTGYQPADIAWLDAVLEQVEK